MGLKAWNSIELMPTSCVARASHSFDLVAVLELFNVSLRNDSQKWTEIQILRSSDCVGEMIRSRVLTCLFLSSSSLDGRRRSLLLNAWSRKMMLKKRRDLWALAVFLVELSYACGLLWVLIFCSGAKSVKQSIHNYLWHLSNPSWMSSSKTSLVRGVSFPAELH